MPNVSTLNQSRGKTRWFDPQTLATLGDSDRASQVGGRRLQTWLKMGGRL